jgi:hypothetical protein
MDNFDARIFRRRAIESYLESRGELSPPRFAPPRVHLYAGLACALVSICALLMWTTRVPTFVSVRAAAVAGKGRLGQFPDGTILLVFIPVTDRPSMKEGQRVYFKPNSQGQMMSSTLIGFEPEVMTRAEVLTHYELAGDRPLEIDEPVVVGITRVEPPSNGIPVVDAGSVFDAEVEIGTKRLLCLFCKN